MCSLNAEPSFTRNALSLIAEWQSGFQDYAITPNLGFRTHLPVESYYVQAGYFLTGESCGYNKQMGALDYNVKPFKEFFGLGRGKQSGYGYMVPEPSRRHG